MPEEVWQRFLTDNERAIRATAPKEPSALQRTRPRAGGGAPREGAGVEAVGDLWHPDDPWEGPSWRELDGRARLRRVGRVVGTAAALAFALVAWSQLSTGAGAPDEGPGDTVLQQSEDVPAELPTAASPSPAAVPPPPSGPGVRAG
ncbi:hypothetical protein ADK41_20500 [Streptomyces caelestis]|uniref:Uncharacterized protein n=1 Tax=Streptomyces caelestis TaxID=36816 RepID=A0A0M8QQS2_9ACTN|nr:hypothetical protein ADK41_20500 [Streptomyces caelestis]KOV35564.1 hypothetical protein ADK58_03395 [Streptomyces sp. XY152]